jgi:NADPH2:quinone reductase
LQAWLMDSFAGVGNLRVGEVTDPQPGAGEVLLKIRFAALNPADAFLAAGQYPAKPPLPHILGRDAVGEVAALGPGVENVRVGDLVSVLRCEAGVNTWGTLAGKTVVPAASVAPVPEGWSLQEAAGAPLVFLTAWQALTQWTEPEPPSGAGQMLLVTGASGGVGVASVLLGKSLGYQVVALSRSAEKGATLKALGADFVFDPADKQLRKSILAAIDPRRIDLAVDSVAGPLFHQVVAVLGYRGKISVVGRSGGEVPDFNTATLFFRRNAIGGVAVGDYTPAAAQLAWKQIVGRLQAAGKRPVIDHVFEFGEVPAAFRRLAEGPMGKVLIQLAG